MSSESHGANGCCKSLELIVISILTTTKALTVFHHEAATLFSNLSLSGFGKKTNHLWMFFLMNSPRHEQQGTSRWTQALATIFPLLYPWNLDLP